MEGIDQEKYKRASVNHLWHKVETYSLTTNMRVLMNNEANAEIFSQLLLQIGNGEVPTIPETNHDIILPEDLAIKIAELDDFIDSV